MYVLEAQLTDKVREWLDLQFDVSWYKASERFINGVSDCIICVRGLYVAAELKAEDGKPTPQQILFIKDIKRAGGIADVCYTLGDVKKLIQEARNRSNLLSTTS